MREYMHEYTICTQPDEEIFYKQCAALEKHVPGLIKDKLLQDVDDTLIQPYTLRGADVVVYNDIEIGVVSIKSDIDLNPFFKS